MKKKVEKQIKEEKVVVEPILESRFYWKELTEDGLLKDIKPVGPYYNESNINTYGGYTSREDAFRCWAEEAKRGNFIWGQYVLVEEVYISNRFEINK